MAKTRSVFFCSACGFESPRWLGRCPSCEGWNTFSEAPAARPKTRTASAVLAAVPQRLGDLSGNGERRLPSGLHEFDALLGGGIVPGSAVLIGGPPGVGKSTLMLGLGDRLSAGGSTIYVCGEESPAQIHLRAQRLGVGDDLMVLAETNLRAILDAVEPLHPRALIVDSIQTVWLPDVESSAGNALQVRECAQALVEFAKRTGCATFIVGHVTKDGAIAGPRLLEHLVDTVMYFEGESSGELRILRATKNRFGSVDEICVFTIDEHGLHEVANPSELFVQSGARRGRSGHTSGACIVPSIVGSRPVLVEIQALVADAAYGTPRRLAANVDQARLAMILAVLERRAGMHLGGMDVYASVAGGLRIAEPAADLGIALAIASAFRNVPVAARTVAFGEIGLSGEIRRVPQTARRLAEARKLGFTTAIAPADAESRDGVHEIGEALARAFG
ncbi:MAG: DNA repair protein RadA [Candidatus Eremiobacteraeota bacterium]|nr:DNA repair protein RadA [Candidatus Eremiobacteraeota bacterium]